MDADALLGRVLDRLGQVTVRERFIKPSADEYCVWGTCDKRVVTINPVPGLVETLIHELLHDLHPSWSESYVRNRTTFLFRSLDPRQQLFIYNAFKGQVVD